MSKETVQINLKTLTQQVQDGMKKVELADYYKLPMLQMTKVLQQAGLKIRKFHAPAFTLITEEVIEDVVAGEAVADVNDIEVKEEEVLLTQVQQEQVTNLWED